MVWIGKGSCSAVLRRRVSTEVAVVVEVAPSGPSDEELEGASKGVFPLRGLSAYPNALAVRS